MRTRSSVVVVALVALSALAQSTATPLPQKHIPANVLMELRAVESQFDLALARDCAPERCVSKGCVYVDHSVVDKPTTTQLPGLGQPEGGPGALPPQEYLTQARCEFAHEKSVATRDVEALVRRLEQRLSKGWLAVKVTRQILEPISPALSESPPLVEKAPPKVEPPPPPPTAPVNWDAAVAVRELWVTLLPHFWWMILLFIGSLATLVLIWGFRRVGRESLEEKALLAQLSAPKETAAPPVEEPKPVEAPAEPALSAPAQPDAVEIAAKRAVWRARFDAAELDQEDHSLAELLREWLRTGAYPMLAKALFVFGEHLSKALNSDGELAAAKVSFADYVRSVNESDLPSEAEFFERLEHHSKAAALTVQPDTRVYRSLRDEFGTTGLASLIARLPRTHGAMVLALVPYDTQDEVVRALDERLRVELAGQLLRSNRMSKEDRQQVFQALELARSGLPVTPPGASAGTVKVAALEVSDRGHVFDAAGALSVLLPTLSDSDRRSLVHTALQRSNDVAPAWYADILYPDMLLKLPDELRADALLEVDARSLAGWLSSQPQAYRDAFVAQLSPSLQNAVRANSSFNSREEQYAVAKKGRDELVAVMKRLTARGQVPPGALLA